MDQSSSRTSRAAAFVDALGFGWRIILEGYMRLCIYCGHEKFEKEFSDEHIWPDALGGDFLPAFWRSDDVCGVCNNMSGVFVDGAFIKSFFISGERAQDALDYLSPKDPKRILPLVYMGEIKNIPAPDGEAADFWLCAPGANIVHFRKAASESTWDSYAGGDPRGASKASKAGRVLVSITSAEAYWIDTVLQSVRHHFPKAEKLVTNLELLPSELHFKEMDRGDPQHVRDLQFLEQMEANRAAGERLHNRILVDLAADSRFLAKLALATGYKVFGKRFLGTASCLLLRKAFREANSEKRKELPIKGSGYLRGVDLGGAQDILRWSGGWVLMVTRLGGTLALSVLPPSGRAMVIQITEELSLMKDLPTEFEDGVVWVTVPPAGAAAGPIAVGDYLSHQIGQVKHAELTRLESFRGKRSSLPPANVGEESDIGAGTDEDAEDGDDA